MKLWLIRHPPPDIAAGVCYGATDVAARDGEAERQATRLAEILPRDLPVSVSPRRRCTLLADRLAALRPDLPAALDPCLAEMDFGRWEGQRWSEIPRQEYDGWLADFPGYPVGGAETVRGFMDRVAQAFERARQTPEAAWITHAGVIRAANLLAHGVREVHHAAQWPREAPACGEWQELWIG